VVVEARHLCMEMRGVEKAGGQTVTSCMLGCFRDNPELRQFFARAAPDLDLNCQEVRAELRQHVRLPTAAIAQLWRLSIGSGAAARRVRVPTLILQGQADRVVRPRDTRVLGGRLGGPVHLLELAAGHLLLDPAAAAWEHVRDLILSFVRP